MERIEDKTNSSLNQYTAQSVHSKSHPAAPTSTLDERSQGDQEDTPNDPEYRIPPCACTVQHSCPGRIIKFIQDDVVIKEVPNNKEMINKQAREYVRQDSALWVPCGGYCCWDECFDTLERTKSSAVIVIPIRPFTQKFLQD